MKQIIAFFKQTDKQLHMMACFIASCVMTSIFLAFDNPVGDAVGLGWMCAFGIAAIKEIYDEITYKGGDVLDWIADIIGFCVGTLFMWWLLSIAIS